MFPKQILLNPNVRSFFSPAPNARRILPPHHFKAVLFDLAGTLVDTFCIAPHHAFAVTFKNRGILLTPEEISAPMGKGKREHIASLLDSKKNDWYQRIGKYPTQDDIDELHREFIIELHHALPMHDDLTPYAEKFLKQLKFHKIPWALTTGYDASSAKLATTKLFKIDKPSAMSTADRVSKGCRFEMLRDVLDQLKIPLKDISETLFCSDSPEDIRAVLEGCTKNKISPPVLVGVTRTSTRTNITSLDEFKKMPIPIFSRKVASVQKDFAAVKTPIIVDDLSEVAKIVFAQHAKIPETAFKSSP